MTSKMVKDKQAEAARLRRAAKLFKREVAPEIERRLAPRFPAGERPPDLARLADLAVDCVDERLSLLEAADKATLAARAALPEARCERDLACAVLGRDLAGLRKLCRGLYGAQAGQWLVGQIPQQPELRLRQAERVVKRLRHPDLSLPPVSLPGVEVDPERLASGLEPRADALWRALAEVVARADEAERRQEEKGEAMAAFDVECGASLRMLVELTVLVGRRDLAARMRRRCRG